MNNKRALIAVVATMGVLALPGLSIFAQQSDDEPSDMGFFVTSVGIGDGGGIRSFLREGPGGYAVEFFAWLDSQE